MVQAIRTTTVPWTTCDRFGHSTFLSSAHDSRMKENQPPRPTCR